MTDGELPLRSRRHSSDQRDIKDEIIMRNAKTSEAYTEDTSSFLTPLVWCILVCVAAERFAYFGFRAVLVLYFTNALHFSEPTAIALLPMSLVWHISLHLSGHSWRMGAGEDTKPLLGLDVCILSG
jgi:hypothetical protein